MRRLLPLLLAIALVLPLGPGAALAATDLDDEQPTWLQSLIDEVLARLLEGLYVGAVLALEVDENGLEDDENGLEDDENGLEDDEDGLEDDENGLDETTELDALDDDENDNGTDGDTGAEASVPKGWIVSTVARCAPVGPGLLGVFAELRNHGAFVTAAAHGVTDLAYAEGSYDLSTLEGAQELCAAIAGHGDDEPIDLADDNGDENGDENGEDNGDENGEDNGDENGDVSAEQALLTKRDLVLARVLELRQEKAAGATQGQSNKQAAHERRDERAAQRGDAGTGVGQALGKAEGTARAGSEAETGGQARGKAEGAGPPEGRGGEDRGRGPKG